MTLNSISDDDSQHWRRQWNLRSDTIYLNHGSFGPPPQPVLDAQRRWKAALDEQPMDFFVRQYEPAWREARRRLAAWLDTRDENLVFVENATHAMNVVADSFPLQRDEEVLFTDHEYGAVLRIWERRCAQVQAAPPVIARLPLPMESVEQVVDALFAKVTSRTRLIVVSHITSPTAVILPVAEICRRAAREGIAVCIDGPHAPAQVPLSLDSLNADFYAASCHKWLSAPFGSGFLYVAPRWQDRVRSPLLSWGRLLPAKPEKWDDEFLWSGTRDSSPYFSIPTAIDFLESYGMDRFRETTHALARYARQSLVDLFGLEPIVPDDPAWYGTMAHVPLPPGDARVLQIALWQQHHIEVPIVAWNDRRYVRVSCHLYNDASQIDALVHALKDLTRTP
ncbi:MAG: aminotransferase class V-fold PLP-dependent enzyme [Pirellulales bacterium]